MLFNLEDYLQETEIYVENENTIREYVTPLEKSNMFFNQYPEIKEDIKKFIQNLYDKKYIKDLEPLYLFDKELKLIKYMLPVIVQNFVNLYERKYDDVLNFTTIRNSNNILAYKIDFLMNTIVPKNKIFVKVSKNVNYFLNKDRQTKYNIINLIFDNLKIDSFVLDTLLGTYMYDYSELSEEKLKLYIFNKNFDKLPKELIENFLDKRKIKYYYDKGYITLKNMDNYYEFKKELGDYCVFKAIIKDEYDYDIIIDNNIFSDIFKTIINGEYIVSIIDDYGNYKNIKIDNGNAIENLKHYMQYANIKSEKCKLLKL